MKRVLWLSQHPPLPVQVDRLRVKFGLDVQICRDVNSFESAQEIISRFRQGGYDDYVVVAPQSVIGKLCEYAEEFGVPKPLYAEMRQLLSSQKVDADFSYRGRYYKFICFRRVKRAVLEFEDGQDF